jgi:DNA-binding transcriptional MerR regulator/methanogenic corrinoid protein MtbC1
VPHGQRTYEIQEVAELTGLSPARLRAWERRYSVVRPHRLPNRYRVYSADQVALLRAFARLVRTGERIGALVAAPREKVLARAEAEPAGDSPGADLMSALRGLDRERAESLVAGSLSELGLQRFAEEIVLPLGQMIGDQWALGRLSISVEHLASEIVVQALKRALSAPRAKGPVLLAACLPGERHEWGVLAFLATIQPRGWRAHYLGPDLPLNDVIDAAWQIGPGAVALSTADPATVEALRSELARLPAKLPAGTVVAIGGRGAGPYEKQLRACGFHTGARGIPELPRGSRSSP